MCSHASRSVPLAKTFTHTRMDRARWHDYGGRTIPRREKAGELPVSEVMKRNLAHFDALAVARGTAIAAAVQADGVKGRECTDAANVARA